MSTSGRIVKNAGFLYAKMGITMFVSLYTTRLILNSLGASDFGVFNIVGGAIAMLGFLNAAMASATQRFMSYAEGEGNKDNKKIIFNISIILNTIIAFIVLILLLIASYFFFNGLLRIDDDRMFAAKVVYGCLIVSTMLTVVNVPYDAVMNSHENMLYYSVIGIIESVLKLIVAFACVYTTFDKLIVYGVLTACIPAITLSIMKVYCHHHYEECVIAPKRYYNSQTLAEMIHFAGWNFLSTFTALISGHGSNLVLNHYFGTTLNAANGVTGQLNGQLQVFGNTLLKALNPVIVKKEGGHERNIMFKFAFTGAKMTVCLYAFFAIPFIIDRDYILQLWLVNVPNFTSEFVQLGVIWVFCDQIGGTLGTVVNAVGRIREINIIHSSLMLFNIFLIGWAFHLGFPPQTMLIISSIISLGKLSATLFYCKKYARMSILLYMNNVFARSLLVITLVYCATYVVWNNLEMGLHRFILVCLFSSTIYTIMFYNVCLVGEERSKIRNMILNLYQRLLKSRK